MVWFDPISKEWIVRIVYDGPARSGKTANLKALAGRENEVDVCEAQIEGMERTVTFDWMVVRHGEIDGVAVKFQLVSTPGFTVFRRRREHILHTADVVVFLCDSGMTSHTATAARILEIRGDEGSRRDRPLVVQANKQDAPNAWSVSQLRDRLKLPRSVTIVPAQAIHGHGVVETFESAAALGRELVRKKIAKVGLDRLRGEPESATALRLALRSLDSVPKASRPAVQSLERSRAAKTGARASARRSDAAPARSKAGPTSSRTSAAAAKAGVISAARRVEARTAAAARAMEAATGKAAGTARKREAASVESPGRAVPAAGKSTVGTGVLSAESALESSVVESSELSATESLGASDPAPAEPAAERQAAPVGDVPVQAESAPAQALGAPEPEPAPAPAEPAPAEPAAERVAASAGDVAVEAESAPAQALGASEPAPVAASAGDAAVEAESAPAPAGDVLVEAESAPAAEAPATPDAAPAAEAGAKPSLAVPEDALSGLRADDTSAREASYGEARVPEDAQLPAANEPHVAPRSTSPTPRASTSHRGATPTDNEHHRQHRRKEENTMSVDNVMKRAMKEIPKCVAAGIVDLDSGMLLNVKTVDSHPQEVLDLVAAATKDLYEGDNVTAIESAFKQIRGVRSDEHYFQQIMVLSTNLIHFFARMHHDQGIVLVAVCRKDANLGLVLAKAKSIALNERL